MLAVASPSLYRPPRRGHSPPTSTPSRPLLFLTTVPQAHRLRATHCGVLPFRRISTASRSSTCTTTVAVMHTMGTTSPVRALRTPRGRGRRLIWRGHTPRFALPTTTSAAAATSPPYSAHMSQALQAAHVLCADTGIVTRLPHTHSLHHHHHRGASFVAPQDLQLRKANDNKRKRASWDDSPFPFQNVCVPPPSRRRSRIPLDALDDPHPPDHPPPPPLFELPQRSVCCPCLVSRSPSPRAESHLGCFICTTQVSCTPDGP